MLHSITDVHAHYDEAVFDTDRGEVLRTLREAGVCAIVNSGSSVPSSRRSLDLAKRFEGVYASVGVFPLEAYNVPSGWLEQISDMAEEDGCVAVGEIGLDYHLEECGHNGFHLICQYLCDLLLLAVLHCHYHRLQY